MRPKPLIYLPLFIAHLFPTSGFPTQLSLGQVMSADELDGLAAPIFSKQILDIGDTSHILVTRDYGSGLELRDAYLYRSVESKWELILYRRTNSSRLTGRVEAGALEIVSAAGKVIDSIPINSLMREFDPKEHQQ